MKSWPLQPLSSVAKIIQGGRLGFTGKDFTEEGYPAYGAGGLNGYLREKEFSGPAVILSSIGARCGKCFYVDGDWTSLANTQLIFPDVEKLHPRFLWYQINGEHHWIRHGTGQPYIKPTTVKEKLVAVPALEDQDRLVNILDQAVSVRDQYLAGAAEVDRLTESLIFRAVSGEL